MKSFSFKNFLLLTIFAAPLYLIKISFFGIPSNVFESLMLVSITYSIIFQRKSFLIKKNNLLLAGIIFLMLGLISSIIFNENRFVGLGILKGWFMIPMLFSAVVYKNISSIQDVENTFKAIFFSSSLVGLISIFYKFFHIVTFDQRLSSFYLSPNYLAMYLTPGFFFGLYLLAKSFRDKSISQIILYILLLIIISAPLYYTYSYATWLALFFSLLITCIYIRNIRKYFFYSILAIFFSFFSIISFQTNTQKFSDLIAFSPRSSLASRIMIWKVSQKLILQNPIVGIGPGNFQAAYLSQQPNFPPYLEWAVPQPHNIFLAFWLQTGIVGLVGFLLILFYVFSNLQKILQKKNDAALLAAPLFAFFLYTILHGMVDTTYWKNDLAFLFWICLSITIFLKKLSLKTNNAC